jgi:hypothetical protein
MDDKLMEPQGSKQPCLGHHHMVSLVDRLTKIKNEKALAFKIAFEFKKLKIQN